MAHEEITSTKDQSQLRDQYCPELQSVLPSRKMTDSKYGDGESSLQQMTHKRKRSVSIYLFKAINRSTAKKCKIFPKFMIIKPE